MWAVDVFRFWQATCTCKHEKKNPLLKLGSEFKDYDFHCVQTLEKRFKIRTAFPFWLTKFIQEVANKMDGHYLPCSL